MRKKLVPIFSLLALLSASFVDVYAEVVIVVNPANKENLSNDVVKRIFLGKAKSFPGGGAAVPIDQPEGSNSREKFYENLVGKNEGQLKAYWAQLIFSGKGTPPNAIGGDQDVKNFVAKNPNAIGYIDKGVVDNSVKVVGKVN